MVGKIKWLQVSTNANDVGRFSVWVDIIQLEAFRALLQKRSSECLKCKTDFHTTDAHKTLFACCSLKLSTHTRHDYTLILFTRVMCVAYLDDVDGRLIFSSYSTNINLVHLTLQGRMHSVGYSSLQTYCGTGNVYNSERWHICTIKLTYCFLTDSTDHILCQTGLWCIFFFC